MCLIATFSSLQVERSIQLGSSLRSSKNMAAQIDVFVFVYSTGYKELLCRVEIPTISSTKLTYDDLSNYLYKNKLIPKFATSFLSEEGAFSDDFQTEIVPEKGAILGLCQLKENFEKPGGSRDSSVRIK